MGAAQVSLEYTVKPSSVLKKNKKPKSDDKDDEVTEVVIVEIGSDSNDDKVCARMQA